jgi:hypothetical protein
VRRIALLAICAAALSGVAPAFAGSSAPSSGISGVVRNTTCPGPCRQPPPPPPLYTGDGLVVKIRNRETHQLLAVLHPKDGRFSVEAGPGSYHVHAFIHSDGGGPSCWHGSSRNVGIVDHSARVRLTVENRCIV